MQLREIEYVVAVAKYGNFTRAAESLGVSQPALSQAIKRLEEELGVTLLDRSLNPITITSAGQLFLDDGINILDASQRLQKKMADIVNTEEGIVRLGISTFYSAYHLVQIVPVFKAMYPDIHLETVEDISLRLEEYAMNGTVDFSLVPFPLTNENLAHSIVHHEQILFAIPSSSPLRSRLRSSTSSLLPFFDLRDAADEDFIFLKPRQRFYTDAIRYCESVGFTPHITYDSMSWDTINALISRGLGVGFIPEIAAERSRSQGSSTLYCRLIDINATRPYALVWNPERKLTPPMENFMEAASVAFATYDFPHLK